MFLMWRYYDDGGDFSDGQYFTSFGWLKLLVYMIYDFLLYVVVSWEGTMTLPAYFCYLLF